MKGNMNVLLTLAFKGEMDDGYAVLLALLSTIQRSLPSRKRKKANK